MIYLKNFNFSRKHDKKFKGPYKITKVYNNNTVDLDNIMNYNLGNIIPSKKEGEDVINDINYIWYQLFYLNNNY